MKKKEKLYWVFFILDAEDNQLDVVCFGVNKEKAMEEIESYCYDREISPSDFDNFVSWTSPPKSIGSSISVVDPDPEYSVEIK